VEDKMMKKSLFEATAISLMLVAFIVPSVLAYPVGPFTIDNDDGQWGEYDEYVTAGIGANVGPYGIDYGGWYAARTLGDAQGFNGLLWWHFWFNPYEYIEWYSAGTEYAADESITPTTGIASHVWSGFYDSELYSWEQYAFIAIVLE
jgi:hypothetical protein